MMKPHSFAAVSDDDLLAEVQRLARAECQATAGLIAALMEIDARSLYLGQGYSSLFAYCTRALHLSEGAAYGRIEAARAVRRFPLVLERLEAGALTLTAVGLLAPHLTPENHRDVLDAARHRTKREVEEIVARLRPRTDVPSSIRKLPSGTREAPLELTAVADGRAQGDPATPAPAHAPASVLTARTVDVERLMSASVSTTLGASASPPSGAGATAALVSTAATRRAVVAPLAPERYKVQITIGADTHAKLRRVQDLLRHTIPDGDPAVIFDRALTLLLEKLERTKLAAVRRPRPPKHSPKSLRGDALPTAGTSGADTRASGIGDSTSPADTPKPRTARSRSRHIPATIRRAVWMRDQGQCSYVGPGGRCRERGLLQIHHRVPFAVGGETTVANLCLLCAAHNKHEASEFFGPELAIGEGGRRGCAADTQRTGPRPS